MGLRGWADVFLRLLLSWPRKMGESHRDHPRVFWAFSLGALVSVLVKPQVPGGQDRIKGERYGWDGGWG